MNLMNRSIMVKFSFMSILKLRVRRKRVSRRLRAHKAHFCACAPWVNVTELNLFDKIEHALSETVSQTERDFSSCAPVNPGD